MPIRKKDTGRALGLLEEYCTKLRKPEEQQLKTAIQRVMGIFKSNLFEALLDTPLIHHCVLHSPSSFTLDMPTHQPMRACHASVSAPSRSLELGSRVILACCLDRSMKKEEEMFLYLECGHFISRIYSRSNTRITSRWSVTSPYKHTFNVSSHNTQVGSSIPSLTLLHAEVSLGKMLSPEWPPIE
ncbi:unnamed protein product [Pleuronectes platessa]|uniref:L27-1 domain-containing protein n=1 Tax=Pleuronectes platessa TaxID=8262 RepID=A0A9N7VCE2_PLEPL|nr:unnamed protein product [Pleuronectes platessa]